MITRYRAVGYDAATDCAEMVEDSEGAWVHVCDLDELFTAVVRDKHVLAFGNCHVLSGNADLEESCVWQPTEVLAGTTPLPDCYHVAALGTIETKGEK